LVGAIACGLGATAPARACGPDFPYELLSSRTHSLLDLVDGSFEFEVLRLAQADPNLHSAAFNPWDDYAAVRTEAEAQMVPAEQHGVLAQARAAPDAARAYALGETLPSADRHYVAGAVAFQQGDTEAALTHFRAVLDLPEDQRAARAVWAQFMVGRIAAAGGDIEAAAQAFAATRTLAQSGAPDPMGLAVASFGDEARMSLAPENMPRAMALYVAQAAQGSRSGMDSVLEVARTIAGDPDAHAHALADPLTQRVLAIYAHARAQDLGWSAAFEPEYEREVRVTTPALEHLIDVLSQQGDALQSKDRLAAVAYRAGRFDLAERLARAENTALAAWVRAKLALRAGDDAAASAAYAEASRGFPAEVVWSPSRSELDWSYEEIAPRCRVDGERGVLALSRGDYLEAMTHLYAAAERYWVDAAYVAERVLSVDELQRFVDTHAPTPSVVDLERYNPVPANNLRALLARRLLREERYDDALRYIDAPEVAERARAYVDARLGAERGGRIERAEQWWQAALIARNDGMDLLGFEGDPDYFAFGGNFDFHSPYRYDPELGPVRAPRTDLVVPRVLSKPEEQTRVRQSGPKALSRFHYRMLAADLAEHAADLLPERSQAFAAVLCGATGFVLNDEPERGRALWWRYVKHGPYVPWAENFGWQCQEPDFAGAAERLHFERVRAFKRYARQSAPWLAVLGALGVGAWWWRRRRAVR
jgi:tetratricopeptide (TPR) repeat protein